MTTDDAPSTGPAAANTQAASTLHAAVLHRARSLFGFVPSLLIEMARSPAAANAYLSAMEALQHGAFTEAEQHMIMLAVSAANDARYCMVAHSEFAQVAKVTTPDLDSVTALEAPSDMRLNALTKVTWRVIEKRGRLDDSDMNEFEQIRNRAKSDLRDRSFDSSQDDLELHPPHCPYAIRKFRRMIGKCAKQSLQISQNDHDAVMRV